MGHLTIEEEFTQLGLSSAELLALGLVYGFSQSKQGVFYGSREYIRKWVGCASLRTVDKIMQTLVDKGFIEKGECYEGGVKRNTYQCKNCTGAEIALDPCKNCTSTSANSAHKSNSESLNKDIIPTITRVKYGEFVEMTEDEYAKLVQRFGEEGAAAIIEILDNGIGAKGYKYKSHYRAALTWPAREYQQRGIIQRASRGNFSGPKTNNNGETATVASFRASRESFERIAARHCEPLNNGVDFLPAPDYDIDEQNDAQL